MLRQALEILRGDLRSGTNLLLAVDSTIDGNTYEFPVDGSVTALLVTAVTDGAATLRRPDGSEVIDGDSDAEVLDFGVGESFLIAEPATGNWSVTSTGIHQIIVEVESEVALTAASVYEDVADDRHMTIAVTDASPIVSESTDFLAALSAVEVESVQAYLVDLDGERVEQIDGTFEPETGLFTGRARVLTAMGNFRMMLLGTDAAGNEFQRVSSR
ncbi:MAG: hypothetical protein R3344_14765, partial [Acidobacteriota bacterium]|nr:hypothetical protein [Acidobacteriota bacterium]